MSGSQRGVILYVVDRIEAEHIRQWPVDCLADVKLHRFSLVTTTSTDIILMPVCGRRRRRRIELVRRLTSDRGERMGRNILC
jgi:hypothetical protein